MTNELIQILIFFFLLIMLAPLLGNYMTRVYSDKKHFLIPVFGRFERWIYRFGGIQADAESNWKHYTIDLLLFSFLGFLFVFILQLLQMMLPLNPSGLANVSWHSAFNTAVSFMTNTNWQGYAGETTLSHFVQMLGLTVQNFVSAASGMAVLLALTRGIARKTTDKLGNFYVDLTRSVLYVLLPLSLILSLILVSRGVIQNFHANVEVNTLVQGQQSLPMGPVASQIAIKQLGTNGGGFFNANSAHPYENPDPFTNLLEMISILLIPAAMTFMFGKMTGSMKHGWVLFLVMLFLLIGGLGISLYSEMKGNPQLSAGANLEGKELRFGTGNSVLWSVVTTAASNGSVNAMHDSLTPLSGLVALINIMLGEVIFGGVGAGLYGMVIFVILTVFIAGLMVGRTPEYLGKKIEAFEIQMAIAGILAPSAVILIFSAWAVSIPDGLSGLNNAGPHGFSEILYAFTSAAGNNGSAFAGLNANTVFYNLTLGIGMIIGRFGVIIPVLAIAGSLAKKKTTPVSEGTFRTDNWLFAGLLTAIILIVGGLTFFPAISLGPLMEHYLMLSGVSF
ncbi:MAG: potassium-transporting ATPase subunit KdpA [Bacteroidales bacterium]